VLATSLASSKPRVSHLQNKPATWSLERLLDAQLGRAMILATPSVAVRAAATLPFELVTSFEKLPKNLDTLIAIGGGTLMDIAKVWRAHNAAGTQLIVVPSLWGSGAEVSPVAVLNQLDKKEIQIGDQFVPDICCYWPQLSQSIPDHLARYACGDAWSHAVEGFLSPLADNKVQQDLADVIQEMIGTPLGNDPLWYELSTRACTGQAQSSVGLVHGIAHSLEPHFQTDFPEEDWGHAKLCSHFLWPVMEFNRQQSPKWDRMTQQYQLDGNTILELLQELHESKGYKQALGLLEHHWMEIVRDPCSRTNSALVRPGSKSFFMEFGFQ
jgi:alcohol dehydrogenase class IV